MKRAFYLLIILIICFPYGAAAQNSDSTISVSGFVYGRNRYSLATSVGGRPDLSSETTILYDQLKNIVNFSNSGTVKCFVDFGNFYNVITPNTLVDEQGKKRFDIFFAGETEIPLTEIEVNELIRFLNSGGVLYISGEPNLTQSGSSYNVLFNKLNISDNYSNTRFVENYSISSNVQKITEITSGPFGDVKPLIHASYLQFNNIVSEKIFNSLSTGLPLILELNIGSGKIVITSSSLHRNVFMNDLYGNKTYFLNMFALGCRDDTSPVPTPTPTITPSPTPSSAPTPTQTSTPTPEPQKILNVPSFKQGIYPLGNQDPAWETDIYDTGDKQSLWCGQTIGQCGCAMTSAAMILAYNNVLYDSFGNALNPGVFNNYLSRDVKKIGNNYLSWGYSYGNFIWNRVGNFSALSNRLYPHQPKLDGAVVEDYNFNKLKNYLDENIPVILKVKNRRGGTHWVVIKGYQGQNLIINDPAMADPVPGKLATLASLSYTPQSSRSMISYRQTHSDYRNFEIITRSDIKIMVTDLFDQKTGFASNGLIFEEIPGSIAYFNEDYDDSSEENLLPPPDAGINYILVSKPQSGLYRINLSNPSVNAEIGLYVSSLSGDIKYHVLNAIDFPATFFYEPQPEENPMSRVVKLDILPLIKKNKVILKNPLPVPIAILSENRFDAFNKIDKNTLSFGKTGNEKSVLLCLNEALDVNADNLKDLVCLVNIQKTMLGAQDKQAIFKAVDNEGFPLVAYDSLILKR